MKIDLIASALSILTIFLFVIPSFGQTISDESIDADTLKPWQIHKILAEAKAGEVSRARAFATEAARTMSLMDQTTYDVGFHRIELEIDIPDELIYGNVLTEATPTVDGLDSAEVDLYSNLTVDSVYTSGGILNYAHANNKLYIDLDGTYNVGETFTFTVRYHGHPVGSGFDGFSFDYRDGVPVVSTLSEPMSARTWWPCKDRPDDKADSLDIFITCDTAYFCASNGALMDTARNGDGTWTFNYEVRYPITTYLFSLAISDYIVWHNWYYHGESDSMRITHHVYPERYSTSLLSYSITPFAIQVFAGLFGEYPFINEKYGHANFEWGGGMEHQTCTSMSGGTFGFSEPVIVHELAHQWWGDMVTCNNWHEIWLNEGFASYAEALYYEAKDGVSAYHSYMQGMKYTGGGTIYVYDTTSVWNIFSSIVYDKGAWLLHMLRHIVGDGTFFDILQTYYNSEYKFGDATTEQFKNVCEAVSGMELDYFFDEWIYGTYYPRYSWSVWFEQDPIDSRYSYYIHVEQTQTTNPNTFTMPVDFVFYFMSEIDTFTVFNDKRKDMYFYRADEMFTDVELDPENWILKLSTKQAWTLHLIPFPLDTGVQYQNYVDSVIARGGSGDNLYQITSGDLPYGLELDSLTGIISGTPTESGEFTFDISVKEREGFLSETLEYTLVVLESEGLAGDIDNNGDVDLLDATFLINYLYRNGPNPDVPNQADPDASCTINILDASHLISYLYREGPEPLWGCVE
jgi:aminopeptidase N